MLAKEICERCEKVYRGGPYSFYCPKCRSVIAKEAAKKRALRNAELKNKEAETHGTPNHDDPH